MCTWCGKAVCTHTLRFFSVCRVSNFAVFAESALFFTRPFFVGARFLYNKNAVVLQYRARSSILYLSLPRTYKPVSLPHLRSRRFPRGIPGAHQLENITSPSHKTVYYRKVFSAFLLFSSKLPLFQRCRFLLDPISRSQQRKIPFDRVSATVSRPFVSC